MQLPEGDEVPGARARRPGRRGEYAEAPEGPRRQGVRPGEDRRGGPRARRADPAAAALQAHDRGRRRPAGRQAGHPAPGGRLDRDPRCSSRRGWWRSPSRPTTSEDVQTYSQALACTFDGLSFDELAAAELLVQLALRGVPDVRRPRRPSRGRPDARRARPGPVDRRGRAGSVVERPARVLGPGPRRGRGLPRVLDDDPVEEAAQEGPRRRPVRLGRGDLRQVQEPVRPARVRTGPPTRASSPSSSAVTSRPTPRASGSGSRSSCARSRAGRAAGARLRPETPRGHGRRPEHLAAHRPFDPRRR